MNDELRERLAALGAKYFWGETEDDGTWADFADAILAEIEAAGYVLMERDRAERLRQAAAIVMKWFPILQDAGATPPKPEYRLHPGDLDPLEGGE